jgi:hypothetical protein
MRHAVFATILLLCAAFGERLARADENESYKVILGPAIEGDARDNQLVAIRDALRALGIAGQAIKRARIEKVCEYADPPRVYPLIGLAQLRHVRYRTIIETETGESRGVLDVNHLHLLGQ